MIMKLELMHLTVMYILRNKSINQVKKNLLMRPDFNGRRVLLDRLLSTLEKYLQRIDKSIL